MTTIMGLVSLFFTVGIPIILLIWVNQLKKNSQIQIEQNKKMIELLEQSNKDKS